MRVTKIIREYVEKTVTAKMPYGEPTKAFAEAKNLMEEERAAAERDIKAYAEMRLGNVNDQMPNEFKIYLTTSSIVYSTHYNAPLAAAAREHEREVQNKRRAAIDNILLNLELGATKADLERLIAEAVSK
jgi:hypothetical protein